MGQGRTTGAWHAQIKCYTHAEDGSQVKCTPGHSLWEEAEAAEAHCRQSSHAAPTHADRTRARSTFPLQHHLFEFQLGWQHREVLHPPGWGFDGLSVPAWHWTGLSHKSLTTGNTNEPLLGMLRRKTEG